MQVGPKGKHWMQTSLFANSHPMLWWHTWSQMFMHAHLLLHPAFGRRTRQCLKLKSKCYHSSNSWFQVKNDRCSLDVHSPIEYERLWKIIAFDPTPSHLESPCSGLIQNDRHWAKQPVKYSNFCPCGYHWLIHACTILGQPLTFEECFQSPLQKLSGFLQVKVSIVHQMCNSNILAVDASTHIQHPFFAGASQRVCPNSQHLWSLDLVQLPTFSD